MFLTHFSVLCMCDINELFEITDDDLLIVSTANKRKHKTMHVGEPILNTKIDSTKNHVDDYN